MPRPKKEHPNRKDGLYEVKVTIGKRIDGSLIRKSFYSSISKDDARKQAQEYTVEQAVAERTGTGFVSRNLLFAKFASTWLSTYKLDKVREHTYNFTYKSNLEKYLVPYFGTAELSDIRQADVQQYFNTVIDPNTGKSLARSTLEKHRLILKEIFDKAIDNDLCYKNPVRGISLPAESAPAEKKAYTQKQSELAEEYARMHDGGLGIVIMLNTGIRRSELCGLKWSDIDFEHKLIHIQRAVVPTTGKIIEGDTKSLSSNRRIPISNEFIDYLSSLPRTGRYVLAGSSPNKPQSPNTFAARFRKFMDAMNSETGLPVLSPHELRHSYGTILREKDVDIYTIQKVMGHADLEVTAQRYVHNDLNVLRRNMGFK